MGHPPLHFIHYNFARIHKMLRITPVMAAGLSDHVWSYEEIVALAQFVIMRKIVAILLGCIVLSGCRADPPPTIWKTGLSSPDGKWMAMAHGPKWRVWFGEYRYGS